MSRKWYGLMSFLLVVAATAHSAGQRSVVAPRTKVEKLAGGFRFTEGPAADVEGNIYFTDIPNNRIHKWSLDGKLSTFRENSEGANGLFFDKDGNIDLLVGLKSPIGLSGAFETFRGSGSGNFSNWQYVTTAGS